MRFAVGTSGEIILFEEPVLDHLSAHRQTRLWHREAGGLLFARIEDKTIRVVEATGPRPTDRRSRFGYAADRAAEQAEIDARHPLGLHYVGDWHSHPERWPTPSGRDVETMASRVLESRHELGGILFAIIGTAPLPDGLTVVVHDGKAWHRLGIDATGIDVSG